MEFEKIHLEILKMLNDNGITSAGKGLTLREINAQLKEQKIFNGSQMTVNRKVWALRDGGYIASKLKINKADMFYIVQKGKETLKIFYEEE